MMLLESSFCFPIAFSDIFFLAAASNPFKYSELTDSSESDSDSEESSELESDSEEDLEEASEEVTEVKSSAVSRS